jgi:serine protease AprX
MKSMGTPQRTDDLVASYSSKGPTQVDHIIKPDLVAPGNLVVSLLAPQTTLVNNFPTNAPLLSYYESTKQTTRSTTYFTLSGTSMAAPAVSGAAALLLQQNPSLTPDQIKAKLMRTAYKTFPKTSVASDPITNQSYASYYDVFTVGAGYLDIAAALRDQTVFTGTALSPVAQYQLTAATVVCSAGTVCANPATWSANTIWGNNSVSGSNSIWGNNSLWGNNSIWGNSSIWANGWVDAAESTYVAIYGEH